MNASAAAPARQTHWRGWRLASAVLVLLGLGVALGEWSGWPFLAAPLERQLSDKLQRRVRLVNADADVNVDINTSGSNASGLNTSSTKPFGIRFIGGLRLSAPQLEIAAPAWSTTPHTLLARNVRLDLRYVDLWHFYRGQPLRVQALQADTLDANLERLADGRASWQFGQSRSPTQPVPSFGLLLVKDGTVHYRDEPLDSAVEAHLSLTHPALLPPQSELQASSQPESVLQVHATGHYRKEPLKLDLISKGELPWVNDDNAAASVIPATSSVPFSLNATVGRASLVFNGSASDVLHLASLSGRFSVQGPSLAAVGEPLGVTLPTTYPFRSDGMLVKKGELWHVVVEDATVGASRLNGAFSYDRGRSVPLLSGRLGGSRLLLVDLGPAVGTSPTPPVPAQPSTTKSTSQSTNISAHTSTKKGVAVNDQHKVLPARPFNLAALRAMDANVLINIDEVNLNTRFLEPLHPLHAHLQLADGILSLHDLDARTAQGQLTGDLRLDGRQALALWNADLRWSGVKLEHWIHQTRAEGLPPYISGEMKGRAMLQGQGRSTAEILASLKGGVHSELRDGKVSHLIVEAAGLDVAQGLGVLVKGDDALPVQCGVTDLIAEGGVLRPRVMVIDTTDSAIWIDGSLSLATEALDLRAVVMPKDFSPLALRAPLHVRGSFSDPEVSLEKGTLGLKLGSAFLLALVNPLAAVIPLIDTGDADAAARGVVGCMDLMQRSASKNSLQHSARTAAASAP